MVRVNREFSLSAQLTGLLKRWLPDVDTTLTGIHMASETPTPLRAPTDSLGSGSLPGFHNLRSYILTHVQ
jgi:hypothetical protein